MAWAEALERASPAQPAVEVNATTAKSLPIRYHDRTAVGADRIANAVAVRALYGTPAIVVDLGTATTFDCVSRAGRLSRRRRSRPASAPRPRSCSAAPRASRGSSCGRPSARSGARPRSRCSAGVMWGHAGQVDALVRRLALEMKGTPHVIATGGLRHG